MCVYIYIYIYIVVTFIKLNLLSTILLYFYTFVLFYSKLISGAFSRRYRFYPFSSHNANLKFQKLDVIKP